MPKGTSRKKITQEKVLNEDNSIQKKELTFITSDRKVLETGFFVEYKDEKKVKKDKPKHKISIKLVGIITLVMLILFTLIFAIRFINFGITEMIWRVSVTKGSSEINNKSVKYESFRNGLLRISNDGITFINTNGNIKWTNSFDMKDPIYKHVDKYFAIADRNEYNFYIFNENGLIGKNNSTFPIQNISLSDDGVLYVLMNDENGSYINLYRKSGVPIDITLKYLFNGDGIPNDLSTSKDGTELLIATTILNDEKVYSKAIYYNFDEVGKNTSVNRIVGSFVDEFKDKYLARVHFFNNEKSFLMYDGGVYFVSTSMLTNPTITNKRVFDNKIKSIAYNDKYLVIVFDDGKVISYNSSGMQLSEKKIDFEYDNFYISDNYVIFLIKNRVVIYDTRLRMIFDKELNQDVQYVAKKKSPIFTELLLGLIDGVECIRFY